MITQKLFTPKEVSQFCGLSYHTVLRAVKANELQATRLKGRIRVPDWAVEQWIEHNMIESELPSTQRLLTITPKPPVVTGSLARLKYIEKQQIKSR